MTIKVKRVNSNLSLVEIDLPTELARKILKIQQCESQFQGRAVSLAETFELILDDVIEGMEAELAGEKRRSTRKKKSASPDDREANVFPSRDGKKGVTWH